jgi:hypothetical protein
VMLSVLKMDAVVEDLTDVFPVRMSDLVTSACQIVILCIKSRRGHQYWGEVSTDGYLPHIICSEVV